MTIRRLLYKYLEKKDVDLEKVSARYSEIQDELGIPSQYKRDLYDIIRDEGR